MQGTTRLPRFREKNGIQDPERLYKRKDVYLKVVVGVPVNEDEVGVDQCDYEKVKDICWTRHSDGYAYCRRVPHRGILMHRFILGITDSDIHVDHDDHNPRNNTRANLKPGTQQDNNKNTPPWSRSDSSSKFKGVGKYRGGWRAQGYENGKTVWLGKFSTEELAHTAYEDWKRRTWQH